MPPTDLFCLPRHDFSAGYSITGSAVANAQKNRKRDGIVYPNDSPFTRDPRRTTRTVYSPAVLRIDPARRGFLREMKTSDDLFCLPLRIIIARKQTSGVTVGRDAYARDNVRSAQYLMKYSCIKLTSLLYNCSAEDLMVSKRKQSRLDVSRDDAQPRVRKSNRFWTANEIEADE